MQSNAAVRGRVFQKDKPVPCPGPIRSCAFLSALLILPLNSFGDGAGLSDAMKSAATGDQTPIEGSRSHHDDSSYDSDGDESFGDAVARTVFIGIVENFHGARLGDCEYAYQFPLDAEFAVPFNGDIRSMTRFSITPLSVEGERAFFGLSVNGGMVEMKDGSLADAGTASAWTIGFGPVFRYYFIRTERPFNPYVTARVGWQDVSWEYRSPIVLGDGGRLSGDNLNALDSYAGAGVAWHRERMFSLYSEVGVGGMIFSGHTPNGFHNDVFENFPYFAVKAGLSFKF